MEPFIGLIFITAFNFPPKGYAFCAGQILQINQNQALFALLGTTFGGDGIRTFALPDLRGRVPLGAGIGSGLPSYTLGERGGQESHTLLISEFPQHNHSLNGSKLANSLSGAANAVLGAGSVYNPAYSSANPTVALNSAALGATGGNQPVGIQQPYLGISFIIALQGIFPSRN